MRGMQRSITRTDRFIAGLDEILRASTARPPAETPSPGDAVPEAALGGADARRSAALMRVNRAGEVAAQALYLGQALAARSPAVRDGLLAAAREERDHLAWCDARIDQLGGRRSLLDPFWFGASLLLGAAAGSLGDRLSLGFVAETERQVEAHLDDHLRRLPAADGRSAAVLRRMAEDEARHGRNAELAGGAPLPSLARRAMGVGGGFLRRVSLLL